MLWFDEIAKRLDKNKKQLINDSKTPSGRAHVGSLRGVLIHDAVFRALSGHGFDVRYTFGVDDYDPLDELPAGQQEFYQPYLGRPLCQVPTPSGSSKTDIAELYISDFFSVFNDLGIAAEIYRMRDIYKKGTFNEPIERILNNSAKVRDIYYEVSKSKRSEKWMPFQAICEQCGKIGTTEVVAYNGREVEYFCRPNMVSWAQGCNYHGQVSPFDGRGKLPWKLEWVAKWASLGITIEGAGKDHNTKGGSRDVASRCLKSIFDMPPPLNIPYEFFLVEGMKMSSSKGIGISAREMADFLPPEMLRYLMLRSRPNRPVNFSPEEKSVAKLFNDFDQCHSKAYRQIGNTEGDDTRMFEISEVKAEGEYFDVNFPMLLTLVQLEHLDPIIEAAKRKGSELTQIEIDHLKQRLASARYWLDNFGDESQKYQLQQNIPECAHSLSQTQRAFLHILAQHVKQVSPDEKSLQSAVFAAARKTPLPQSDAFAAFYCVLLAKDQGPKAGNLMSFLDQSFLVSRFTALQYDLVAFWRQTAQSKEQHLSWLIENKEQIRSVTIHQLHSCQSVGQSAAQCGVMELHIVMQDDKEHTLRQLFDPSTQQEFINHVQQITPELAKIVPLEYSSSR